MSESQCCSNVTNCSAAGYKSPTDAINAPKETVVFLPCVRPGRADYLAVVDVDPASPTYSSMHALFNLQICFSCLSLYCNQFIGLHSYLFICVYVALSTSFSFSRRDLPHSRGQRG
jgi:hypothetical protein